MIDVPVIDPSILFRYPYGSQEQGKPIKDLNKKISQERKRLIRRLDRGETILHLIGWHRNLVFLPFGDIIGLSSSDNYSRGGPTYIMSVFARWMVTKGIYLFDETTAAEIIRAGSGELNGEVFRSSPEWCIWVPTPFWVKEKGVDGFFFCLDEYPDEPGALYGNWMWIKSYRDEKTDDSLVEQGLFTAAIRKGEIFDQGSMIPKPARPDENEGSFESIDSDKDEYADLVPKMMALTSYICATNAEINNPKNSGDAPKKPVAKKFGYIPPSEPKTWEVGFRIGSKIREYYERCENPGDGHHSSPRPHVRCAHWHSYWTGPRSGERKLIVHWLAPILVGGEENIPTGKKVLDHERVSRRLEGEVSPDVSQ